MTISSKNEIAASPRPQTGLLAKTLLPLPKPKPTLWKLWIMGGIAIIFSVIFWWTLSLALLGANNNLTTLERLQQFGVALAFFCIMLALFGVAAMVAKRKTWWITAVVSCACSLGAVAFFPFRLATFGAALITLCGFLLWSWNVAGDVQSRIKFQPHYTIHAGFGTGLILLLLGISLAYYSSLGNTQTASKNIRTNIINSTRDGIDRVLPQQIPGYKGSMTLDEFLSLVATDKFGDFVIPQITQNLSSDAAKEQAFKTISKQLSQTSTVFQNTATTNELQAQLDQQLQSEREALQKVALTKLTEAQRQLLDEARREFLQSFKIEAKGSDTMDIVIEKIITRNITKYVDPYEKIIPPLLALSIFFLIEFISVVYRYIIFALAPVFAWVYAKFGLIRMEKSTVDIWRVEV